MSRDTPRIPLNKQRILASAVAFADRHGVEALTMRQLADDLGFGVMSLYNHVANKDEMLDGMVDLVADEIEPYTSDGDWKVAMRRCAVSAHDALTRHPWATGVWSSRRPGEARLRLMDSILGGLRDAELGPDLVYRGFHAISMHIEGFTRQELSFEFDGDELEEMATAFLDGLPAESYPHLREHVLAHIGHGDGDGDRDGDSEFEFVLNLILDGLENASAYR